jgi:CRISPR-associated exonuclease Cas4
MDEEINITGVQMSYYVICKTKLWLHSHKVSMEQQNENVKIGKELHEIRYKNERKEVSMDNIKYDFVRKGKNIEIHEIKKTDKLKKAHTMQVLYYLFRLDLNGIKATGFLDYPLTNKHKKIVLEDKDKCEIIKIIENIKKIISDEPPQPEYKNYCKSCSYFEFCWC